MTVSFLSPARTILLIADEALYIYVSSAQGPRLVEVVSWDVENFEIDVARILSKDCKGRPVLIVNDMVEQHYRKERVLRSGISLFDKANFLKRKLGMAFPNYPIRAAYPLKEKAPRTGNKRASDIYIFAAVPESKQMLKTVAAVNLSLVAISGFCLLPVESSDMVKALSNKLVKKLQARAQWIVFIGQHRNGSLRQIVIKNGELALTRMTPITDINDDSALWAAEVHQEFNATMSYLSRFGFQREDGLYVILIAEDEDGEAFGNLIDNSFGFSSLTAPEAARLLNIPFDTLQDDRYADPLHAAWIGRKTRLLLPMNSARIDKILKPRRVAMAASILMLAGACLLGYWLISETGSINGLDASIDKQREKLAQLNVEYQKEIQRKEELGFDVRLVQSSIAVYDELEKENIQPLPIYQNVALALGKEMRVDKIDISKPASTMLDMVANPDQPSNTASYVAALQMTYPSTADIDKGNQEVADLQARLQSLFPKTVVTITKALKDYGYNKGMIVETGKLENQGVNQDFVAAIEIRGTAQ